MNQFNDGWVMVLVGNHFIMGPLSHHYGAGRGSHSGLSLTVTNAVNWSRAQQ